MKYYINIFACIRDIYNEADEPFCWTKKEAIKELGFAHSPRCENNIDDYQHTICFEDGKISIEDLSSNAWLAYEEHYQWQDEEEKRNRYEQDEIESIAERNDEDL
jgi:hypothetical protein